jgi:hypothetical protein
MKEASQKLKERKRIKGLNIKYILKCTASQIR